MSEFSSKTIRDARAAKAKKMASADPHEKVDSSTWTPPDALNADIKTGLRPVSRRAFKSGGKVEGMCGAARADKMPRKGKLSGGALSSYIKDASEDLKDKGKDYGASMARSGVPGESRDLLKGARKRIKGIGMAADKLAGNAKVPAGRKDGGSTYSDADRSKLEAMIREAQKTKDIGNADRAYAGRASNVEAKDLYSGEQMKRLERGYKKGGRVKKMNGGPMMMAAPDQRGNMVSPTRMKFSGAQGTPYKKGGATHSDEKADKALIKKMVKPEARTGRKDGGRAKGKTNINIIIGQPKMTDQGGPQGLPAMPGAPNMGGMPGARPPVAPIPMGGPAPGGAPGMAPPPPGMPPMARKAGGRITKVAKSYKDMEAGAGSGEGRLQKTDIAARLPKKKEDGANVYQGLGYPNKVPGATGGRTARKDGGKTYRSYKDMDAGAGSGEGRLEKTEIQHSKRGR